LSSKNCRFQSQCQPSKDGHSTIRMTSTMCLWQTQLLSKLSELLLDDRTPPHARGSNQCTLPSTLPPAGWNCNPRNGTLLLHCMQAAALQLGPLLGVALLGALHEGLAGGGIHPVHVRLGQQVQEQGVVGELPRLEAGQVQEPGLQEGGNLAVRFLQDSESESRRDKLGSCK